MLDPERRERWLIIGQSGSGGERVDGGSAGCTAVRWAGGGGRVRGRAVYA